MKALSLFSGIGGLDIAAQACGIEPVAFCEIEPFPVEILKKRFPGVPILPDVRKVNGHDFGAVDVIFGGFPCQDLSVAGRRAGLLDKSGNATRSGLWFEMLRIISGARPRFVVAENVRGAINAALDVVQSGLESEGYEVKTILLPVSAFGAPHQRERIFILGIRKDVLDIEGEYRQRSVSMANSDQFMWCEGLPYTGKDEKSWPESDDGDVRNCGESCGTMADSNWPRLQRREIHSSNGQNWPQPDDEQSGRRGTSGVWRTPDANADRGAMSEALYQRRVADGRPININAQVAHYERNWPTANVCGLYNRKGASAHSGDGLATAVKQESRGQLNPDWVEQLMGYPDGWTDPDCDEPTPWCGWPARPGEMQYPYEHPRTVTSMKDRAKRLKALGNAVVPQQAEPIFRTVQMIDKLTREK